MASKADSLSTCWVSQPENVPERVPHRRADQHHRDPSELGRHSPTRSIDQERDRDRVAHAPQTRLLPRQNSVAIALREIGRIERTLFILDWLQSIDLRRRVNNGLNKGEVNNALARAVFFNRLGEIRDRTLDHQRHRASGLNLLTAAIILWNTVYHERATTMLHRFEKHPVDPSLLPHLSPLGWEHINLTGDNHRPTHAPAHSPLPITTH